MLRGPCRPASDRPRHLLLLENSIPKLNEWWWLVTLRVFDPTYGLKTTLYMIRGVLEESAFSEHSWRVNFIRTADGCYRVLGIGGKKRFSRSRIVESLWLCEFMYIKWFIVNVCVSICMCVCVCQIFRVSVLAWVLVFLFMGSTISVCNSSPRQWGLYKEWSRVSGWFVGGRKHLLHNWNYLLIT